MPTRKRRFDDSVPWILVRVLSKCICSGQDGNPDAPAVEREEKWPGPDEKYSPEPDEIRPHALAFARLMFAHAAFEREVRSLQGAITNDPGFGERRDNQWAARKRSKRMAELIKEHLGDDLPEAESIATLLTEAIVPCDQRTPCSRRMVVLQHSDVGHHCPRRDAVG
jgi:hypothetical protein